jgi:Fe-S oxidoreductase
VSVVSSALKHPFLMRSLAWLAPVALHYTGEAVRGKKSADRGTGRRGDRGKKKRGRVAFFPGCAVTYFQPDIGQAARVVLDSLGYEVVIPSGLACCGRPYLSLGDRSAAEDLARKNAGILSSLDAEVIVTACASCGLTFKKDYPALLAPSGGEHVRVLDIHEFLDGKLDGVVLRPVRERVTWHDPCHLGRGQGLAKTARGVLRAVPGIELAEMQEPDRCCGFGGVMRMSHPSLSGAIGGRKARDIMTTGAQRVVTGCPGCRMQIADSLRRAGSSASVVHTVQVLAESLGCESSGIGSEEQDGAVPAGSGPRSNRKDRKGAGE